MIEDVAGLRPRNDNQVELSPIDIGWPNFAVNNLRYRNTDLSVVWDDPADGVVKYAGVPQGYSVYVNGSRAFTVDKLVPLVWNPATGAITFTGVAANVIYNVAVSGMQVPNQVVQNSARMIDIFAKAGADLTSTAANLAQGATTSASFTASGTTTAAAVDGFPINEPQWGTKGSPNAQDWLEINFGQARTVDDAWVYFRNDRASAGYRPPSSYTSAWETVAAINDGIDPPQSNDTVNQRWGTWPNQGEQWAQLTWTGSQALGSADVYFFDDNQYNHVTFTAVSTTRLRVVLTGTTASVGLLEVKAFG